MEVTKGENGRPVDRGNRWKDKNKSVKPDPNSNAYKAYNYFLKKGFTPVQSAGIVGNLAQESTIKLDSGIENQIGAFGIAQWLNTRRTDLNNFAKSNNKKPDDFNLQLDFIWHELNTTEKRAFKALKTATTPDEAAIIFEKKYERAGEKEGDIGFEKRKNYANQFYRRFNTAPTPFSSQIEGAPESFSNTVDSTVNVENKANSGTSTVNKGSQVNLEYVKAYNELLKRQEEQEQQMLAAAREDEARAKLDEKIRQRDFMVDLVNNSDVEFIPAKRAQIT